MGHETRLEVNDRDIEYRAIGKENDRLVIAVTNTMARMVALHADTDATAEDKTDVIALRDKLRAELNTATTI